MLNPEAFQLNDRSSEEGALSEIEANSQESPSPDDELRQLQQLLLGDDLGAMADVNAAAVAKVLPQAILQARAHQEHLTLASVLTVESAIRTSVSQDVNVLSEALFPVIGPAARKSVAAAIDNLVQSFERTLEQSLSPQSFRWRLEAWRTGKSFAEVVLLRTLIYQVEQVLLIHKETGLVLQHVVGEAVAVRDPDMVSAMLTAIQDFVKDSFSVTGDGGLDTLELGDFNLWLEEGPQAVLACVIRGTAPQEFRATILDSLEKIHLFFRPQLLAFDGDRTPFIPSKPYLEDCLAAQFRGQLAAGKAATARKRRRVLLWAFLGAIAIGLAAKAVLGYRSHQRWLSYIERVNEQPGIVVLDAERKRGQYYLTGLRDPLAADPEQLLQATQLDPDRVQMSWEPYISTAPDFTEARAQTLLDPPPSVTLNLDQNRVLSLSGSAPEQWIQQARRLSRHLGLTGLDETQLVSAERQQIQELKARIESQSLDFVPQGTRLQESDRATLGRQARDLRQLFELTRTLGESARVILAGYSDPGVPAWKSLGQARSEAVHHALLHEGIRSNLLVVRAPQDAQPVDSSGRSAVRFIVQLQD